MTATAIEAEGLAKTFPGGVTALDGIDLAADWGQVLAYLGRNGSGKTTTVRILTTLTRATAGSARVAGLDVERDRTAVRRVIGVTMQDAALDPVMSGREHLELSAGLWGLGRAARKHRAAELLERFGLGDVADRAIEGYSGGMRRRLDIATALIAEPRVLFLDEPTTGLDPQSRRAMWEEIRGLRAAGSAVFLTTQYLEEAEALADQVVVLDAGRIVARGTVAELKRAHTGNGDEPTLEDVFVALTGTGIASAAA